MQDSPLCFDDNARLELKSAAEGQENSNKSHWLEEHRSRIGHCHQVTRLYRQYLCLFQFIPPRSIFIMRFAAGSIFSLSCVAGSGRVAVAIVMLPFFVSWVSVEGDARGTPLP